MQFSKVIAKIKRCKIFVSRKMVWLSPKVKFFFEDMNTRFDTIYERGRQQHGRTDGQTPHDGIGRLMHSIARQKLNSAQTVNANGLDIMYVTKTLLLGANSL